MWPARSGSVQLLRLGFRCWKMSVQLSRFSILKIVASCDNCFDLVGKRSLGRLVSLKSPTSIVVMSEFLFGAADVRRSSARSRGWE